jgi:hypothetical protein
MSEARIENGKAVCPRCGHTKNEIYRRLPEVDGLIQCLAKCLSCDNTFSIWLDKYGAAVPHTKHDPEPGLPFDEVG